MPPPPALSTLSRPELEALLVELFDEVEALKQLVAEQRGEIARLKGLKGRPAIKPSGMDKGTEPPKPGKQEKRRGRGRVTPRVSIEEKTIAAEVPPGSRFKGHAPRQRGKVFYPLREILLLLLCATVAGAHDFVEIGLWGRTHLPFLRRFLRYRCGIPSHDTLCEVIAAVDPPLFKACFLAWVETLRGSEPNLIAIDGKTSRRSHDRAKERSPLHLVSA